MFTYRINSTIALSLRVSSYLRRDSLSNDRRIFRLYHSENCR